MAIPTIVLYTTGEYTALLRTEPCMHPCIGAWRYDESDGTWQQGHYFNDLGQLDAFMSSKQPTAETVPPYRPIKCKGMAAFLDDARQATETALAKWREENKQ